MEKALFFFSGFGMQSATQVWSYGLLSKNSKVKVMKRVTAPPGSFEFGMATSKMTPKTEKI